MSYNRTSWHKLLIDCCGGGDVVGDKATGERVDTRETVTAAGDQVIMGNCKGLEKADETRR